MNRSILPWLRGAFPGIHRVELWTEGFQRESRFSNWRAEEVRCGALWGNIHLVIHVLPIHSTHSERCNEARHEQLDKAG